MAHKTKAEKKAEQEAESQLQAIVCKQLYLPALQAQLERADRFDFAIRARNGKLALVPEAWSPWDPSEEFEFGLEWSWSNQLRLEDFVVHLDHLQATITARDAQAAARQAALNKLTPEERKLLGL